MINYFEIGQSAVGERNRDFWTITNGLSFKSGSLASTDKIIWLGDFNYRIEMSSDDARARIQKGDLKFLLQFDQLKLEIGNGNTFVGFKEGDILFDPTYKYDNGTNIYDTSEKYRTPSWTGLIS